MVVTTHDVVEKRLAKVKLARTETKGEPMMRVTPESTHNSILVASCEAIFFWRDRKDIHFVAAVFARLSLFLFAFIPTLFTLLTFLL